MEYAFGLGANLGDRLANLQRAKAEIAARLGARQVEASPVYQTAPVGVRAEYRHLAYLNAVLVLECAETSGKVSEIVHAIEADMGRVRTDDRFAPRPIDIDILYAGNTVSDMDELILPHPRWAERRFVVQPLADVRPYLVLPGRRLTVAEILQQLPNTEEVELFARNW